MRPPLFWLLIFSLAIPRPAPGADPNGQTQLSVRTISYRAIPHERTAYLSLPGSSSTNCYGSATDSDFWTIIRTNCRTVTNPPLALPVSIQSVEVYNLLEANGTLYTVGCTGTRIGGGCTWLIPGETFDARVENWTMWIRSRGFGNTGKERWLKYNLLDMRAQPPTSQGKARAQLTGSYSGIVRNSSAGVSAHFSSAIREESGAIYGCINIRKPLYGSGALQGTIRGSQISFGSVGSAFPSRFQIDFQGERQGDELNGTYSVRHPSEQTGQFELSFQTSEAPQSGFNLKQCIGQLATR